MKFIHIPTSGDRTEARDLLAGLDGVGFAVAGVEAIAGRPSRRGEVRHDRAEHRGFAAWLAAAITARLEGRAPPVVALDISRAFPGLPDGRMEVWMPAIGRRHADGGGRGSPAARDSLHPRAGIPGRLRPERRSRRTCAAKASGPRAVGSRPISRSRLGASGAAMAERIASAARLMMLGWAPARMTTPLKPSSSRPPGKPASLKVSTSGRAGMQTGPVTARALRRPPWIWGMETASSLMERKALPAITSCTAGAEPR